ncbi:hypothetical protein B484DRAFT_207637, partial [Ochromonadaceae sp. CCMP2298]
MLMAMQDELLGKTAGPNYAKSLETQVLALQRDVAERMEERAAAVHDRERIERVFELAELLRDKYQTLMGDKLAQSAELAVKVEDGLTLARSLLEKGVELQAVREKAEGEIFDLQEQLRREQERSAGLDAAQEGVVQKVGALEQTVGERDAGISALGGEIEGLKEGLMATQGLLEGEKERTVELSAELLSLANRRDLLEKEVEAIRGRAAGEGGATQLRREMALLRRQMEAREVETEGERRHLAAAEMKASQATLAAEALALQCREKLLLQPGDNQAKMETMATEITQLKAEGGELRTQIRRLERALQVVNRDFSRAAADLQETSKERDLIAADLLQVQNKYRECLGMRDLGAGEGFGEFHHQFARVLHRRHSRGDVGVGGGKSSKGSGSNNNNNNNNNNNSGKTEQQEQQRQEQGGSEGQLLDSYAAREEQQAAA